MSKFAGMGLNTEQPFRVEILHPATNAPMRSTVKGKEYTAFVDVCSTDSTKAAAIQQSNTDRRLRMKSNQRFTAADLEAERTDFLTSLTVAWCIIDPASGNVIADAYNEQDGRELYSHPGFRWLRNQVEVAAGEAANFIKPRPTQL